MLFPDHQGGEGHADFRRRRGQPVPERERQRGQHGEQRTVQPEGHHGIAEKTAGLRHSMPNFCTIGRARVASGFSRVLVSSRNSRTISQMPAPMPSSHRNRPLPAADADDHAAEQRRNDRPEAHPHHQPRHRRGRFRSVDVADTGPPRPPSRRPRRRPGRSGRAGADRSRRRTRKAPWRPRKSPATTGAPAAGRSGPTAARTPVARRHRKSGRPRW